MNKSIKIIRLMQLIAATRKVYSWNPATNDCLDMLVAEIEKEMGKNSHVKTK